MRLQRLQTTVSSGADGLGSDERLRVGVVGLGKMGLLHGSLLSVLPGVELVALCEKSRMIARFARKAFRGVRVAEDVGELAGIGLDAVYVATSIPSHYSVVKGIYERKIARHVFVEKTLSASCGEAKELCRMSQHAGGVTMVGYQRRFAVTFRKGKELLEKGAVREVKRFKAYAYSSDFADGRGESGKTASRGGLLRDLGSHAFDLALSYFGQLEVSSSRVAVSSEENSGPCWRVEVSAPNDVGGEFEVSWSMRQYRLPEVGILIEGSEGTLKVNDDRVELRRNGEQPISWFRQSLKDNVDFLLGAPEYYREDALFVSSVREGRMPEIDFEAASRVDRLIERVESMAKNA